MDWIELLLVVVACKLYPLPGGKGIRTVLFFAQLLIELLASGCFLCKSFLFQEDQTKVIRRQEEEEEQQEEEGKHLNHFNEQERGKHSVYTGILPQYGDPHWG